MKAKRILFGKKGISLHGDCLMFRSKGSLKKVVYFTMIYWCDQHLKDVLSINKEVLKEFVKSQPQIKKIYMKSDNAGCYHNSQSPEALFNIFKKYGLTLQIYDFNEPAQGKDQCDRESATAKSYIHNYVDNGHDLLNADDVFSVLYYGSGIQDPEVCVVEIDSSVATLTGAKIPSFQNYLSIKSEDKGMVLWRYFNVREEIRIPYSGVTFQLGAILKKPFSKMQQCQKTNTSKKGKERLDRKLNNLFYCHEFGCCEVFHDKKSYENHLIKEIHNFIGECYCIIKR